MPPRIPARGSGIGSTLTSSRANHPGPLSNPNSIWVEVPLAVTANAANVHGVTGTLNAFASVVPPQMISASLEGA